MNLKSRVEKLEVKATSSNQIEPESELDFAAMTDEELRRIAADGRSPEFASMSDSELREIIARES